MKRPSPPDEFGLLGRSLTVIVEAAARAVTAQAMQAALMASTARATTQERRRLLNRECRRTGRSVDVPCPASPPLRFRGFAMRTRCCQRFMTDLLRRGRADRTAGPPGPVPMVPTAPRTPSECCLPGIRTRWSRWIESGRVTPNGPTFGPCVPRTSIEFPCRRQGSRRRQGVSGAEGRGGVRWGVRRWRFRHGWDMRTFSGRFVRIEDDSPCRLVRGSAERYTAPYADSFSIHMRASPSGKASASQCFDWHVPLTSLANQFSK